MPSYQFYKKTIQAQSEFCCLCTEQEDFLANREQLLARGFEVVGYTLFAPNETEALSCFNKDGRTSAYPNKTISDTIVDDAYKLIKNLAKNFHIKK